MRENDISCSLKCIYATVWSCNRVIVLSICTLEQHLVQLHGKHITRTGGRKHCCLWWCSKYLLDQYICNVAFDLQLPNLRGQAWESMGKSSRCIGHSAWMVNLRRERGFNTQGCFYTQKSRGVFLNPSCFIEGKLGGEERLCDFLPPITTGGNEHSADWQQREIHLQNSPELISWVWAVRSDLDANREMVLIISLMHV